jgi:hypothetical protein
MGQVAPNDLSDRREDEQQGGPQHGSGSARLAVTRPRITGPSWAGGAATAASREELLPWFVGTAIPTALVTGTPWAGGSTATASRKHLLSRGRTGEQGKECQSACQTSSNDALHRFSGKGGGARRRDGNRLSACILKRRGASNCPSDEAFLQDQTALPRLWGIGRQKNPWRVRLRQGQVSRRSSRPTNPTEY